MQIISPVFSHTVMITHPLNQTKEVNSSYYGLICAVKALLLYCIFRSSDKTSVPR